MPGPAARPYTIEEYTRTVCPHCFAERARRSDETGVFKDGMLVSHDGAVWLRRFCAAHGETESLYEEDAALWRARAGWQTPTLPIVPDRAGNDAGFPDGYRDGLPMGHGQHTCILLLNVTKRCNYACPACYASALSPGVPEEDSPTLPCLARTVDTVIAREGGRLGVLMLSGGEPTVRRDLPDILDAMAGRSITRIMLNTNGRRIVRDDRFLELLMKHRRRVEVYLQFDGLRPSTYEALRGEDVSGEKREALRRLNDAGIFTTLVMTVRKGLNEDEVGDVARLGLETPRCAGLAIQPMFTSGRVPAHDPMDRVTPTGILRRIGAQTGGLVSGEDFIPLPCSHKDCCDITYMLKTADGGWKSLPSLIGKDELRRWIHAVANTISFESLSSDVRAMLTSGAIQRVFSEQMKVGTPDLVGDILGMCQCIPGLPESLGALWGMVRKKSDAMDRVAERTFRITVKQFMDAHTFHEARIRQCCVHVGTYEEDPRRHSFCWRWLFEDAVDAPEAGFIPAAALLRKRA